MASDCVYHTGEVVSVSGTTLRVRLQVHSACSGCGAQRACGMSESSEREVKVHAPLGEFMVGDRVVLSMRTRRGMQAVLLGYVFPFILLLAVLLLMHSLGFSEGVAALVALGALAPYYLALYMLRSRVARSFEFRISSKA